MAAEKRATSPRSSASIVRQLRHLAGSFVGHFAGSQYAEFVINHRQQFLSNLLGSLLHRFE
jgi:hypothetical protein